MKRTALLSVAQACGIGVLALSAIASNAEAQQYSQAVADSGLVVLNANETLVMSVVNKRPVKPSSRARPPVHVEFDWTAYVCTCGAGGGPNVRAAHGVAVGDVDSDGAFTFAPPTSIDGVPVSGVSVYVRWPLSERLTVSGQMERFDPATGSVHKTGHVSLIK